MRIDALLDIVNSHSVLGRIRVAEERSDVVARSSTAAAGAGAAKRTEKDSGVREERRMRRGVTSPPESPVLGPSPR